MESFGPNYDWSNLETKRVAIAILAAIQPGKSQKQEKKKMKRNAAQVQLARMELL